MNKIVALFAILVHLWLYPATFVVVEVDRGLDVVTMEDSVGYLYSFNGCEDWFVGDVVSAVMYGNGTSDITDDCVIMARYAGTYSQFATAYSHALLGMEG